MLHYRFENNLLFTSEKEKQYLFKNSFLLTNFKCFVQIIKLSNIERPKCVKLYVFCEYC